MCRSSSKEVSKLSKISSVQKCKSSYFLDDVINMLKNDLYQSKQALVNENKISHCMIEQKDHSRGSKKLAEIGPSMRQCDMCGTFPERTG